MRRALTSYYHTLSVAIYCNWERWKWFQMTVLQRGSPLRPLMTIDSALHMVLFENKYGIYGWHTQRLPSRCVCKQKFTVEHARISCSRGGFPSVCTMRSCRDNYCWILNWGLHVMELALTLAYSQWLVNHLHNIIEKPNNVTAHGYALHDGCGLTRT